LPKKGRKKQLKQKKTSDTHIAPVEVLARQQTDSPVHHRNRATHWREWDFLRTHSHGNRDSMTSDDTQASLRQALSAPSSPQNRLLRALLLRFFPNFMTEERREGRKREKAHEGKEE